MKKEDLLKALLVTAEVIGSELSNAAAREMAAELMAYPEQTVVGALRRCKRELSGRLTLAAVIQRLDDGHLGADEAWALCPRSESDTVVWTDEIATAFAAARPLLDEGDQVAARMAFRDAYARALSGAREDRRLATWWPSLGHDAGGRVAALRRAVELGRLPPGDALRLGGPELGDCQELNALIAPMRAMAADSEAKP